MGQGVYQKMWYDILNRELQVGVQLIEYLLRGSPVQGRRL